MPAGVTGRAYSLAEGEMAALVRARDWSLTPLGSADRWSLALRTMLGVLLANHFPLLLWWGVEYIQFYNDAYRPVLGVKHPSALGQPAKACFPEIWHVLGPLIDTPFRGGPPTWMDYVDFVFDRHGVSDEGHFTIACSPVPDAAATGGIGGVLATVHEIAEDVVDARRSAMRDAGVRPETKTAEAGADDAIVKPSAAQELVARAGAEVALARKRTGAAVAVEAALAELQRMFEHAPSFLAVLRGPEHVFERVNEAYSRLVGHRDLIGRCLADAVPEVRGQGLVERLDAVMATGTPFVGNELPILLARTAGAALEERFIDFVYQPLVEADGTRSGVIAYGTDVTEQVRARREAERAVAVAYEARARTTRLQAATAALSAARTPTEVADAALAAAIRATGVAVGTVYYLVDDGATLEIASATGIPGPQRDAWRRLPNAGALPAPMAVATRAPVLIHTLAECDARSPLATASLRALRAEALAALPLLARHGDDRAPLGVVSLYYADQQVFAHEQVAYLQTLADLTAQALTRSLADEGERAARVEAEEANHAKSQFLAVMSHELRTPLNAIGGFTQLLDMEIFGPVTDGQRDALGRIGRSQQHLRGLIDDVLNLAKIEAGRVDYTMTDVVLQVVADGVAPMVEPQLADKGLTYDVRLPAEPVVVRADRNKLAQIILNLLSNAMKFTPPGGRITLDIPRRAGVPDVFVRVSDTGVGIPREKQDAIFEPFVQAHTSLARAGEGTGLGLAIARELARGMGGDLRARSIEGRGSAFTLRLREAAAPGADATV